MVTEAPIIVGSVDSGVRNLEVTKLSERLLRASILGSKAKGYVSSVSGYPSNPKIFVIYHTGTAPGH